MHSNAFSLRGEAWAHKTSLTPPLFFKCLSQLNQESEQSCICAFEVSILHLSMILIFDFGIVPTVWYFFVFYSFELDRHPVIEAIFFLSDFEIRTKSNSNLLTKSQTQ